MPRPHRRRSFGSPQGFSPFGCAGDGSPSCLGFRISTGPAMKLRVAPTLQCSDRAADELPGCPGRLHLPAFAGDGSSSRLEFRILLRCRRWSPGFPRLPSPASPIDEFSGYPESPIIRLRLVFAPGFPGPGTFRICRRRIGGLPRFFVPAPPINRVFRLPRILNRPAVPSMHSRVAPSPHLRVGR